jgi:flavorubredoxin
MTPDTLTRWGVDDPESTVGRMLPREIAPGVRWLGDCMLWKGQTLEHSYTAVFMVSGDESSLLIDTGHPKDWTAVKNQLDGLFANGTPPLRWVFPTHPEVTHSGNTGRLLDRYSDAQAIGDMRDFPLIWPKHVDRMVDVQACESVDLGNRRFNFVEAVFVDLVSSMWGYDEQEQVLFSSDGMGFGHYHGEEHCGKFAEELPDMPIADLTGIFMEYALYWSRLKSVEPKIERLNTLIESDHPTRIICGAHGSPVTDPAETMPRVREGMRQLAERFTLR